MARENSPTLPVGERDKGNGHKNDRLFNEEPEFQIFSEHNTGFGLVHILAVPSCTLIDLGNPANVLQDRICLNLYIFSLHYSSSFWILCNWIAQGLLQLIERLRNAVCEFALIYLQALPELFISPTRLPGQSLEIAAWKDLVRHAAFVQPL